MLLHLSLAVMFTLPVIPVADSVPKFDMVRQCQSEGGDSPTVDRCVADEKDALQQLQTLWAQATAKDRADCTREASGDGTGSYVELQTCLEMNSDVRKARR
jgi:hypothetical protein